MRQCGVRLLRGKERGRQSEVRLFKIRMPLERQLKKSLRVIKPTNITIDLRQFIGSVTVCRIDFKFLIELLCSLTAVLRGPGFLRAGQENSPQPVVNFRPLWIPRQHLAVLADCCFKRSLTFQRLTFGLMLPQRVGRSLPQLLHREKCKIAKDLAVVVLDFRIVWVKTLQLERNLDCLAVAL